MNYYRPSSVEAAAKRRAPVKKAPVEREVINAGKEEAEGLALLKTYLGYALDAFKMIEKRTQERVHGYMEDEGVAEKDVPEKCYWPDADYSQEVCKAISKGLDQFTVKLQRAQDVTKETALTDAVEDFFKQIEVYADPREDTKAVEKSKPHFVAAEKLVPAAFTGPGSLAKLQKCFDEIALGMNTLLDGSSDIKATKIPKALEPDDPRQMSFGFTASTTTRLVLKVAARHSAQYLQAFSKYHPVFDVVLKNSKIVDNSAPAAKRYAEFAYNNMTGYKGDPSKVQPNVVKAKEALAIVVDAATKIKYAVYSYLKELSEKAATASDHRVIQDIDKWNNKLIECLHLSEGTVDKLENAPTSSDLFFLSDRITNLQKAVSNVYSIVAHAAKIRSIVPKTDSSASPEEKFKAYQTSEVLSMAKACAKKLGSEPALCAALGLDVMEDVNAHSIQKTVQGTLDHYLTDITDADWTIIRPLVGKVSGAIDWDVISAGAFLCVMLQLSRAPEASRVFDTLAKAYTRLFDSE